MPSGASRTRAASGSGARWDDIRSGLLRLRAEAQRHGFDEVVTRVDARMADLDEPLLIFVVGEGNFGKSTLINRLAGESVAPTGRLPKTWRVDLYQKVRPGEERVSVHTSGVRAPRSPKVLR